MKNEPKAESDIWVHEILWTDGTPFDQSEVELIKSLTADKSSE